MNPTLLSNYYRNNFGSKRHLDGQQVNARINAAVLKRLIGLSTIENWLDVGTGYGFLLEQLRKKYNIRVEGVELSTQEATWAQTHLSLPIHTKPLNETDLPKSAFDVVSSFEVIEHVADPRSFLVEMMEYVRPNGRLIVMTDNFESAAVTRLRARFPKWIPHTHVSHFSSSSLTKCIQSIKGLVLESAASYNPWDLVGRQWLSYLQKPIPDELAYDAEDALRTEMNKRYKFFHLRHALNPLWASLNLRHNLSHGALMYAVCRRTA